MIHHLKITLRNLRRNGIYSVINIGGLAVGMTTTMLIMLWVYNQLGYDRFHEKENQLYQVWNRTVFGGELQCYAFTPAVMGPTLVTDYPEIKDMSRYAFGRRMFFKSEANKELVMNVSMVDPGFLRMFSFPLLKGDPNTALDDVHSMLITEKAARRFFGDTDPIGQMVLVENKTNFKVIGVMADLPENTRFDFDALFPFMYMKDLGEYNEHWDYNATSTFVETSPFVTEEAANAAIKDVKYIHIDKVYQTEVFLHPISKWHVVGVFKDFIIHSPFDKLEPMVVEGARFNWFSLLLVGLLTLAIALFTVSWQAIRAARANPVTSIKAE